MKQALAVFLFLLLLSACSKNKVTDSDFFGQLRSHEWIEDSDIVFTVSGSSSKHVTNSTDNTASFSKTTIMYGNPFGNVTYNSSLVSPNKIYYWGRNASLDSTVFLTIKSISDINLVTVSKNNLSGDQVSSYYHAR